MVNTISLDRCCCDDVGCLPGVCFVTISFSSVTNAVFAEKGDDPPPNDFPGSPPLLSDKYNPPHPGPDYTGADLCGDCPSWNQEWELFQINGDEAPFFGEPGSVGPVFKFALGQATDNAETTGFFEREVYKLPFAGDACFPCQDPGDDTGIVLTFHCLENGDIAGTTLDLRIKGHTLASWTWDQYRPRPFNTGKTRGIARSADHFTTTDFQIRFEELFQFENYTATGDCTTDDLFPCFDADSDVETFYDKDNCYWRAQAMPSLSFYSCDAQPTDDNPSGCGLCGNEYIVHDSATFGAAAGGGDETLIDPYDRPGESALGNEVFRLCAKDNDAGMVRKRDVFPCGALRTGEETTCYYDVFLRWGWNNTDATAPGKVVIYDQGDGTGPLVNFDTRDFLEDELPVVTGSLDGNHNTEVINGFRYRRIGQVLLTCDTPITIEVYGPSAGPGDCMDFDALALKRL